MRNSVKYVSWQYRKEVYRDLKEIYAALGEDEVLQKLEAFGHKRDDKYPTIRRKWEANWDRIIPFFEYPEKISAG